MQVVVLAVDRRAGVKHRVEEHVAGNVLVALVLVVIQNQARAHGASGQEYGDVGVVEANHADELREVREQLRAARRFAGLAARGSRPPQAEEVNGNVVIVRKVLPVRLMEEINNNYERKRSNQIRQ
jgi:hypothetical protein